MNSQSKTPLVDALIHEGAPSQNEYINKWIKLAIELELEVDNLKEQLYQAS